jgi:hypothetical protein
MTPQEGSGAIRPLCGGKEQFLLSVQVVPGWLGLRFDDDLVKLQAEAQAPAVRRGYGGDSRILPRALAQNVQMSELVVGFACYLEVGSATSQAISRATRPGSRE